MRGGSEQATIILVDVDERPVAPATLDAAVATGADVVVVDARTTFGRAWLDADVRVERAASGGAATALRDLGARSSELAFVAFLDARLVPDEGWLDGALRHLEGDATLAGVTLAAPELGEPTLSFTGHVGARHPLVDRVHDVLYPNPEAVIVRRADLDATGGLATTLSWAGAVVLLGWASTIAGRRFVLDPDLTASGGCSCDADAFSGLAVLYQCLGDAALERALPAAMEVVARTSGAAGSSAVDHFVAATSALARKREVLQRRRVIEDIDVLALTIAAAEPARVHGEHEATYRDVVVRHGLRDVFHSRYRVLVVTPDILTERMAGPAIRAWQIASALADRHEVTLASTALTCEVRSARFDVLAPKDAILRGISSEADIVVLQGFALEGRPYLAAEDNVVIADIYDPLHLEQLELFRDADEEKRRVTVREATRILNEQLVRGDFFVCASAKQRDFWLGQLAGVGRVNHRTYDVDSRLAELLSVVPFGVPDHTPVATAPAMKGVVEGIGADDHVILWGGGIYNWFDPLTLIRAIDALKHELPTLRLFFMGLKHPNPDVAEMRAAQEARTLAQSLRLTGGRVFFNEDWVPYGRRQDFLLEATIGVSTHLDHVETEFSFRTRILDYIWSALPIVATKGDWFADLIDREGLGITVPAGDVDGLAQALRRLVVDDAFHLQCRENLERVRPEFAWSRVLQPIVDFCREPRRAADLTDLETRATLWASDADRLEDFLRRQPTVAQRMRSLLRSL